MEQQIKDFWQDHSLRYLEMALRTDRHERVDNPDGYGGKTGDCGDSVGFYLTVEHQRLRHVAIEIHGCRNTNACANVVAELTEGKTVEEAWEITPERIAEELETLPQDHFHCAELAVGAFYLALADYKKRHPWA